MYGGDTVKLHPTASNDSQNELKLGLTDIDAPERNQSYVLKSRRALMKLRKSENVIVSVQVCGINKYQRSLGKLDCNGVDASHYLVKHSLAWFYAQYSNDTAIENAAKNVLKLTLGLWTYKQPISHCYWQHSNLHH